MTLTFGVLIVLQNYCAHLYVMGILTVVDEDSIPRRQPGVLFLI